MVEKNNLEQYIPFDVKKFRPHQREAIEKIIDEIEAGTETILLNAPVGSGKSLIGYCVARYLQDQGDCSYIYTKTTFLQDQYLRDFKDLKTAMGRSNFECLMTPGETCTYGKCKTLSKFSCPVGAIVGEEIELKPIVEPFVENCLYWRQKYEAIQNPISILNYPYMIVDNMYLNHFQHRKLGVFDEGHGLENALMGSLELQISDVQLSYDLGAKLIIKDSIGDWAGELRKFGAMYSKLAEDELDEHTRDRFETRAGALEECAEFLDEDPDNWVFNITYKYPNKEKQTFVTFKPIEIQEYTDILFSKVDYKLIMSGSILKPDLFVNELGLDENNFAYIEIPSIVPIDRRPIIRSYVGSMSARNFESNLPNLVAKIKEIADNHLFEKGEIMNCLRSLKMTIDLYFTPRKTVLKKQTNLRIHLMMREQYLSLLIHTRV